MSGNVEQRKRLQFSLSAAFMAMTIVAMLTTLALAVSTAQPGETTVTVITVCLLFIPFVLVLFVCSLAILFSLITLGHGVLRSMNHLCRSTHDSKARD